MQEIRYKTTASKSPIKISPSRFGPPISKNIAGLVVVSPNALIISKGGKNKTATIINTKILTMGILCKASDNRRKGEIKRKIMDAVNFLKVGLKNSNIFIFFK